MVVVFLIVVVVIDGGGDLRGTDIRKSILVYHEREIESVRIRQCAARFGVRNERSPESRELRI